MPLFLLLGACSVHGGAAGDAFGTLASPLAGVDGGTVRIGSPCIPSREADPSFGGSDVNEVDVEASPGTPSGAPVCFTYHFQGRVSCPYGQSTSAGDAGSPSCNASNGQPLAASVQVLPQCTDRPAATDVVWSCRCGNATGNTDDGAVYCACPEQTTCVAAIASIGGDDDGLSSLVGSYCIPLGAKFDPKSACAATCDPTSHPCD
jgi:hypothetical protein